LHAASPAADEKALPVHALHTAVPLLGATVPFGQATHPVAAVPLNWPVGQAEQLTRAAVAPKDPALQGEHEVAADAMPVLDPFPHRTHAACPEAPW